MLPGQFTEQQVRLYCRKSDKASLDSAWRYVRLNLSHTLVVHSCIHLLVRYFISWCKNQKFEIPKV